MLFTGEKQLMELTDTEIFTSLYQFQHTDGWQQPDNRKAEHYVSKALWSVDSGQSAEPQQAWCRNTILDIRWLIQKSTYVPVPRRLRMGQGSVFLYLWSVWRWLMLNSPDEAPLWICGPDLCSVEAWNELFASWLRLLKCNTSTDHLKKNWLQTPNWMHVHCVCDLLEEYCWAENVPTLRRKLSN